MNDADWSDAVAWVKERGFSDSEDSIQITEKTLASLMPMDQYVVTRYGFKDEGGYGAGTNGDWNSRYRADALEDVMTETGRLGVLEHCFTNNSPTRADDALVEWAILRRRHPEVRRQQVRDRGARRYGAHESSGCACIHIVRRRARPREEAAIAQKLIKKDDAYKKLFAAREGSRGLAQGRSATNKELLELVQAMDSDALFHSRKQTAGCEDKTQKALATRWRRSRRSVQAACTTIREDPFKGFAPRLRRPRRPPVVNLAGPRTRCATRTPRPVGYWSR